MTVNKTKVAILGGGVGGMAAALRITGTPELRARYDVTVYQLGWRLGGKGASGRQRDTSDRITEHGIHLWMGFYENGFRLMREVYQELGRDPARDWLPTVEAAFPPQDEVALTGPVDPDTGSWARWFVRMPRGKGTPGDGTEVVPLPIGLVRRALGLLVEVVLHALDPQKHPFPVEVTVAGTVHVPPAQHAGPFGRIRDGIERAVEALAGLELATWEASAGVVPHLDGARAELEKFLAGAWERHPGLLMVLQVLDFGLALCRGMIADDVLTKGFDVLDDRDWLDWLRAHGLHAVSNTSPIIRGMYDLVFAYPDGRDRPPRFAAGAMTRSLLRIALSYKGSVMYHMAAGMGDVVFAPIYEVLRRRGVRFAFFHRVESLEPGDAGVAAVRMTRQVDLRAIDPVYDPLFDLPVETPEGLRTLPCWPAEPDWDQIVDGARLKASGVDLESAWDHTSAGEVVLEAGQDFDQLVVALPVGALKTIAAPLGAANPALQRMLDDGRTVEVLATQAWLRPTLEELGFGEPALVMTGEAPVTDTYSDMTLVLASERWQGEKPGSLAYFCGAVSGPERPPLGEPDYPKRRLEQAWREVDQLYRYRSGRLWPNGTSVAYPRGTDPKHFVAPDGVEGEARWRAQYTRVNIDPWERFTLTMPGTSQRRLWPEATGIPNLAIAGDWTRTPINAACVEAAAMSGILAARKVTGIEFLLAGATDFPATQDDRQPPPPDGMPAMVEQVGITNGPGPLELSDCQAFLALVPAQAERLEAWCLETFVRPSNGEVQVRPLVPAVVLQWCLIGKIRSLSPELGPKLGWFPETDVGFWVPVGRGRQIGDWFVVEEVLLAPAILMVDHPVGMVSGREVWGYPKHFGQFQNPAGPDDPGPWTASTYALKEPNGQSVLSEVLRVTRTDAGGAEPAAGSGAALAALHDLLVGAQAEKLLPGIKLAEDLAALVFGASLGQLFLKQLRDGDRPDRACYQCVTTCASQYTFKGLQVLGHRYELTVTPYYSLPIAERLGVAATTEVDLAVWSEFDARFDNARPIAGFGAPVTTGGGA